PVRIEQIEALAEQLQALENVKALQIRQVAGKSGEVAGVHRRDFHEIEGRAPLPCRDALIDGSGHGSSPCDSMAHVPHDRSLFERCRAALSIERPADARW